MYYLKIKDFEVQFVYEKFIDASTMLEEILNQGYEVEVTTDEIEAIKKAIVMETITGE